MNTADCWRVSLAKAGGWEENKFGLCGGEARIMVRLGVVGRPALLLKGAGQAEKGGANESLGQVK